MKVISSHWTLFYKWVLPLAWAACLAWPAVMLLSAPQSPDKWAALPILLAFVGIGAWVYYALIWVLADHVADLGDQLLVRRRSIEIRIPFADMLNIGYAASSQPARLSLRLRKSGPLGDEILFVPTMSLRWSFTARNPVVEALIHKMDAARRANP